MQMKKYEKTLPVIIVEMLILWFLCFIKYTSYGVKDGVVNIGTYYPITK
jgi:hypothetical protein